MSQPRQEGIAGRLRLFSYGDDLLTPLYFAAQSSNLLVVAGLKSLSFPSVNNYLSIGLILP
jgi:hypothetical protein